MAVTSLDLKGAVERISYQINYIEDKEIANRLNFDCYLLDKCVGYSSEENKAQLRDVIKSIRSYTPKMRQLQIYSKITKEIDFIAAQKLGGNEDGNNITG